MFPSASRTVTALAGGGQTGATSLSPDFNNITTVATAGDSVMLPQATSPIEVICVNETANACQVFGTATDTINGIACAVGYSQPANSQATYISITPGKWSVVPGAGYSAQFPTLSTTNAITAKASGTISNSTLLTTVINRVTTVTTGGDSVLLPPSAAGMQLTVHNAHASNSMGIFPASGDQINALSASAVYACAAAKCVVLTCAVAGFWSTTPA